MDKVMYKHEMWQWNKIKKVIVTKMTENEVWYNGERAYKKCDSYQFFESFDNAKEHILSIVNKKIKEAEFSLGRYYCEKDKISIMTIDDCSG